ncbi:MAG: hypothetical protein IJD48_01185 [Clostridia bacterium]|nr:hypothetical protein [Clostridia bacterium]MBQ3047610.1 hypothetical protein [Clostridia bacterium]
MNKSLKLTKRKIDKTIKDEQNRVVVDITVQDDEEFLSKFSQTETPVINTEVANFIETTTTSIPAKESLTLRIHSNCITDEEKGLYSKGIKEYYKQKYFLIQKNIKQNYTVAIILTIVSLILLSASILLKNNLTVYIWAEAVNIVAWFFLWEAIGMFSFKTNELRFKRNKYLGYISMKIEYIDTETK